MLAAYTFDNRWVPATNSLLIQQEINVKPVLISSFFQCF